MDELSQLRARYLKLLRERSLKVGHFTLTSGQTSHYYLDAKLTTLDAEGSYLGARLILETIRSQGLEAQAIGGLTLGADPIVASVATVSYLQRDRFQPLHAFIARKQAKGHGTAQAIEGFRGQPGTPVFVVDDVCTTGGSTLRAIQAAEAAGFRVVAVFCLVDRQQGARELLKDYPFHALVTAHELLSDSEVQKQLRRLEKANPVRSRE